MKIIGQAQAYLKEQGVNQWQDNYPDLDTVLKDIKNNNGYVLVKDGVIIGTVAVIFGIEKTYESIYQGQWISNSCYAAIHRIAVSSDHKGTGLASEMVNYIEDMCLRMGAASIRVDTHRDNKPMQKMLDRNGFRYCGLIYLADKSERIAFEKLL